MDLLRALWFRPFRYDVDLIRRSGCDHFDIHAFAANRHIRFPFAFAMDIVAFMPAKIAAGVRE